MNGPAELPKSRLVATASSSIAAFTPSTTTSWMNISSPADTRRIFPTVFTPLNTTPLVVATPATLFPPTLNKNLRFSGRRFINTIDPRQLLPYTDGACLNNGQSNFRAGWVFVYGPRSDHHFSGRLGNAGPFVGMPQETRNRAELRAVIAALRFPPWAAKSFTSLVVATDSEYVALGATGWVRRWVRNGWRTVPPGGCWVTNRDWDLWQMLLGEVANWKEKGLDVLFWRIERAQNVVADAAAKQAAEEGKDVKKFEDVEFCLCHNCAPI